MGENMGEGMGLGWPTIEAAMTNLACHKTFDAACCEVAAGCSRTALGD